MENYLMINGKKIVLTDEQVKILSGPEKKNPFERAKLNDNYYIIDSNGELECFPEEVDDCDESHFSVANYCTDRDLLQQRAWHEVLSRLLWRFACQNGELENPWDGDKKHWYIAKCINSDVTFGCTYSTNIVGVSYFPNKELANRAIEEIVKPFMDAHPDFVW